MTGTHVESRVRGCLLGLAVGDALGAPVEGWPAEAVRQRHGRLTEMVDGRTTDDTAMALCIARSLVELGAFDLDDIGRRFLDWFRAEPVGIGRTTYLVLAGVAAGGSWGETAQRVQEAMGPDVAGNGAAMRAAPIALARLDRRDLLVQESLASARLTHWSPVAGWAAVAVSLAVQESVSGTPRTELVPAVSRALNDRTVKEYVGRVEVMDRDDVVPSGYAPETVQAALWCHLNASTLEEALVMAVNLGGDADTVGAICGAIAGAAEGAGAIPERWLERLQGRVEIEGLAHSLARLAVEEARGLS